MKRSRLGPKSFEEALAQKQKRQAILTARLQAKSTSDGDSEQLEYTQKRSEAAIQGELRSKRRRAEKDRRLAQFRQTVRERDNFTCQWPGCGYQDKNIDVQHIAKRSQRPDLIYDPENGVCLCRTHHNQADNTVQGRKAAKEFGLAGGESYELARKST